MIHRKLVYILLGFLAISSGFAFKLKESNISKDNYNSQDLYPPEKIASVLGPNSSENELKRLIMKILIKDTGDSIKIEDIESAKYWGKLEIKEDHSVELFNIKLSYSLPAVYDYYGILVVDNRELNAYFLPLNSIEPVKLNAKDSTVFFAGRCKRKGYGLFKIYSFRGNILQSIFTSKDYVSNFSLDCISFENDDLKMKNIDLNNDGLLDLSFTGIKNIYCEGFEEGFSKDDRKPLKKEKLTIKYLYDANLATWTSTEKSK
jgi:hypothetical protein